MVMVLLSCSSIKSKEATIGFFLYFFEHKVNIAIINRLIQQFLISYSRKEKKEPRLFFKEIKGENNENKGN